MAATGGILVENSTPENEDSVVSVREYINEVEERERHADLVLGGDKGEECTYSRGYLPRQAVFSCLTCTPEGNAGFCTACSLACHDGHTVVELWTKRKFRCDCGNSKFSHLECKLYKDKDPENTNNLYNQNFLGLYCTCHRRYPDSEDSELGEMLQCCICEDWFHEKHLGLSPDEQVPRDVDSEYAFDEMICAACAQRCNFLSCYKNLLIEPCSDQGCEDTAEQLLPSVKAKVTFESQAIDPSTSTADGACLKVEGKKALEMPLASPEFVEEISESPLKLTSNGVKNSDFPGESQGINAQVAESSGGVNLCKLRHLIEIDVSVTPVKGDSKQALKPGRAIFLTDSWRRELCRCDNCHSMYETKNVSTLLEKGDTLIEYEERAKQMRIEHQEQEADATTAFLRKLNHVQQIEFLHGWNDMTLELTSFLKTFEESNTTVTAPDIREFFENLTKKRRRMN